MLQQAAPDVHFMANHGKAHHKALTNFKQVAKFKELYVRNYSPAKNCDPGLKILYFVDKVNREP